VNEHNFNISIALTYIYVATKSYISGTIFLGNMCAGVPDRLALSLFVYLPYTELFTTTFESSVSTETGLSIKPEEPDSGTPKLPIKLCVMNYMLVDYIL
jgi:hypothetical protein